MVVISALRLPFPLFVSFLALFYVGVLGLCSVLPGHDFYPCSYSAVLAHIAYASLPSCGVFFLAASTSNLLALLAQRPCSFSSYLPFL